MMKYIMLQFEMMSGVNKKVPLIFPDFLSHLVVAELLSSVIRDQQKKEVTVSSAGYINLEEVLCHGDSETLGIESKDTDTWTILRYDYFHGIE